MRLVLQLLAAIVASLAAPASAHDFKVGEIAIGHPWGRATPPSAQTAGGYLTITNDGAEADRLTGVTSPAAKRVEIHRSTVADGVARMRRVTEGLEVPAKGEVALEPGSYHLMFISPAAPWEEGQSIPATLSFEKAGDVDVELEVEAIGARPESAARSHEGMTMDGTPGDGSGATK